MPTINILICSRSQSENRLYTHPPHARRDNTDERARAAESPISSTYWEDSFETNLTSEFRRRDQLQDIRAYKLNA